MKRLYDFVCENKDCGATKERYTETHITTIYCEKCDGPMSKPVQKPGYRSDHTWD